MLLALAGTVYKGMTGGIEWPEDNERDGDVVRTANSDEDWKYD